MASTPREELEREIYAHLDAGDPARALTRAIEELGPELLGYVRAVVRDDTIAADVYATACEDMWRGLAGFRRESSFRTWAYRVTWHAASRYFRDPYLRRGQPLETDPQFAAAVRTTTALYARQDTKDMLAELKKTLAPDELTLLILRVDRGLSWPEIARILDEGGAPATEVALRKRFERLKDRIRDEARSRGLLSD